MAVFKPSNCIPFLDSLDLTQNQDLVLTINTNNTTINGYKIRVLDSNNNEILSSKKFYKINENAMAYNNEEIIIPFIRRSTYENSFEDDNIIHYVFEENKYFFNFNEIKNFKNGYLNQPYKWQVVLAQGLLSAKNDFLQNPDNLKYYDINIAKGVIIGSTPQRIQSALSKEIYKDYFVQLYDSNYQSLGSRVLIKDYDRSYGYIYPQKGGFTQENIEDSKYFQIFKCTNNIEYIETNRIVNFVTYSNNINNPYKKMQEVKLLYTIKGETKEQTPVPQVYSEWKISEDSNSPYIYQKYNFGPISEELDINILAKTYDDNASNSGIFNIGDILLVTDQGKYLENGEVIDGGDAYNGLFILNSLKWDTEKSSNDKILTLTWLRPAIADTWGEFIGQTFYCRSSGENWDSNASTNGVINSTPIVFFREKPVEIYPLKSGDEKKYGEIYKTNEFISSSDTKRKVYVRPFIGMSDGMQFNYTHYDSADKTNPVFGSLEIKSLDTENWSFVYDDKNILFNVDIDTYDIVSFFKNSDENPFYAYDTPSIQITTINNIKIENFQDIIVQDRKITCLGEYNQVQNKMWTSFQWSLYDYDYNVLKQGDIKYGGIIEYEFIGLENNHDYELTLTIEDEFGNRFSNSINFKVKVNIIEDNTDWDVNLNCDLQTVNVLGNKPKNSIIIPSLKYANIASDKNKCNTDIFCGKVFYDGQNNGINIEYGKQIYENTLLKIMQDSLLFESKGYIKAPEKDITLNFENIINPKYNIYKTNNLISLEINKDFNNKEGAAVECFVTLPSVTELDEKNQIIIANKNRYKLFLIVKSNKKSIVKQIPIYKEKTDTEGSLAPFVEKKICFKYQNPNYQIKNDCDYLLTDIPYYATVDEINIGNYNYRTLKDFNYNSYSVSDSDTNFMIPFKVKEEPLQKKENNNLTFGFWSDYKLVSFEQQDGTYMAVQDIKTLNVINDKDLNNGNTLLRWCDEHSDYKAYVQKEFNSNIGFNFIKFLYNIVIKNYKRDFNEETTIQDIKCYIEKG